VSLDWRSLSTKDKSEVVKNLISAAGIVVGGIWVLFQWNTIFPKTQAEVISAASDLRADVSGQLHVSFGDGGATSVRYGEEVDPCISNPKHVKVLDSVVSGSAKLDSATQRPLKAYFEGITVKAADNYIVRVGKAEDSSPSVSEIEFIQVGRAGLGVMLGGLSENRIEKGQSIKSSFLFSMSIPFTCNASEKLVAFEARFKIVPVDVESGADLPDKAVPKVLITACQISSDGFGGCNIANIDAYGQ
jgi:hypothetical protein